MKNLRYQIYYLLVTAVFCLYACSSDDDSSYIDGRVSFRVTESLPDGWRQITRGSLPYTYDSIYVSSLYHNKGTTSTWFYDLAIGRAANDSWIAEDYYYPLTGSLDFIAYTSTLPKKLYTATITPNLKNEVKESNETFTKLGLDFGNKLDWMHDVLYTTRIKSDSMPNTQSSLVFSHATSQLVFNMKPKDENAAEYLCIESITLDNANFSGKVTIDYTKSDADSVKWVAAETKSGVSLPGFSANTQLTFDVDTPKQLGDAFLILPIDPTESHTSITLKYHFDVAGGTTQTFKYEFPSTPLWVPGHRYSYTFTCSLTLVEIEAGAVEEEWNVEIGGNAYEVQWGVEIQAAAMEQYWNSETGASANEETWTKETSGNACEELWTEDPDGPIVIGDNTTTNPQS